jgi:glycosyltransferase involved in cell wall biosynthesis
MAGLSIVLPAHNEAGNLGPLIAETASAFGNAAPDVDYEIIVVDDGSLDGTRDDVIAVMPDVPRLRLIAHGQRAGKSAALRTGFNAARGAWIATLDGDGQNDPADLARLWPEIAAGPLDVIYAGVRRRRNDGALKFATSKLANPVRRFMLRDGCRDAGCGFKVIPRALALTLPYFDNMHRFLPALARREGLSVREVLINDRARRHGTSKYGFFDRAAVAFLDVVGMYWLMRRHSARGKVAEITPHAPLHQDVAPVKKTGS